jgi:hypothetical protein
MKSAEEWSRDVVFDIGTRSGILRVEFERVIKAIQADARKQGVIDGLKKGAEEIKELNAPLSIRRFYERDMDAILTLANKIESGEVEL